MVQALRGLDGALPARPALHVGLDLPDGVQRGVDHDVGAMAHEGVGVDALAAASEGRTVVGGAGVGGAGGCGSGAEKAEDERDG